MNSAFVRAQLVKDPPLQQPPGTYERLSYIASTACQSQQRSRKLSDLSSLPPPVGLERTCDKREGCAGRTWWIVLLSACLVSPAVLLLLPTLGSEPAMVLRQAAWQAVNTTGLTAVAPWLAPKSESAAATISAARSSATASAPTATPKTKHQASTSAALAMHDCEANFKTWRTTWSQEKQAWCCDKRGRGCPSLWEDGDVPMV